MTRARWLGIGALAGAGILSAALIVGGGSVVSPPGGPALNPMPVSGTVAATQGTSPWVISGAAAVTQTTSPWVTSNTAQDATIGEPGTTRPTKLQQVGGWIYQAPNYNARAFEIDPGNGLVTIDAAHHEQHEGYGFTFTDGPTTLASSGTRTILVAVGVGGIHFVPQIDASLSGIWHIYEGPTCSANGTAVTVFNRFRSSLNASTTTVYHTPTCTADGTQIEAGNVGSGGASNRLGGSSGTRYEFLLTPAQKYLVRFTADSNSTRTFMGGEWYQMHDANGAHVL